MFETKLSNYGPFDKQDFSYKIVTNCQAFRQISQICTEHYTRMGEGEKAAKELKDIFNRYLKTSQYEGEINDAYKKSGINGLYEWLIDLNINRPVGLEGMNGHPFYIAWWYAILGRKEEAVGWLQKVNESQFIPYHYFDLITNNPDFDFLRNDPGFIRILKEFGLVSYNGGESH